jgi:hypothetical protein
MNLALQINRQFLGTLAFHNFLIFGENLVIEIEHGLQRQIPVKVAANGDEDAALFGRGGTGCIQDMQFSLRKKDR